REAAAKAAELDRLKSQARQEIADLEARANKRPLTKDEKVVDWDVVNTPPDAVDGSLIRVDCAGKRLTLNVKDAQGKIHKLLVTDPTHVEMKGGETTFRCGPQKPRDVRVRYSAAPAANPQVPGEVTASEFR